MNRKFLVFAVLALLLNACATPTPTKIAIVPAVPTPQPKTTIIVSSTNSGISITTVTVGDPQIVLKYKLVLNNQIPEEGYLLENDILVRNWPEGISEFQLFINGDLVANGVIGEIPVPNVYTEIIK